MKWMRTLIVLGLAGGILAGCDESSTGTDNAPDAPANVAVSITGTTLTVVWDAVPAAESYDVSVTGDEDSFSQTVTETTATFTDLIEGETYAVLVTARNSGGSRSSIPVSVIVDESVVTVTTDVLSNTTWTSDKTYILTRPLFVGSDCGPDGGAEGCVQATLTIEPGTTILGQTNVPPGIRGSYLVVSRGSQIIADANANRPQAEKTARPNAADVIVFTSDRPRGSRGRGDWGGLILNGQAPTNAGTEAQGEGDSGFYGGPDDSDSSGILRGVRIEFAGDDVTPTDQLNGLALQGVGAGTTISYLQIHYNTDDGIEPFGGTVSVDHLVVTGIGDDSVDGTDGYRGFMQFIVGQQRGDDADQGFEISNNGDDGDAPPHSTAVVANATMIGANEAVVGGEIAGAESDDGVQFREGSRYRLYNTILTGFGSSGFCITDAETLVAAQNRVDGQTDPDATLSAEGLIIHSNVASFCDQFSQDFFQTAGFNNMTADPGFSASAFDYGSQSA
ncbi:MAG: fibronectin type III domain-containing protein, partial [Longimicrobiales bacterium]|nr:fibronectin type III domain-containing protein [Longimicrobiales bacterium]